MKNKDIIKILCGSKNGRRLTGEKVVDNLDRLTENIYYSIFNNQVTVNFKLKKREMNRLTKLISEVPKNEGNNKNFKSGKI